MSEMLERLPHTAPRTTRGCRNAQCTVWIALAVQFKDLIVEPFGISHQSHLTSAIIPEVLPTRPSRLLLCIVPRSRPCAYSTLAGRKHISRAFSSKQLALFFTSNPLLAND